MGRWCGGHRRDDTACGIPVVELRRNHETQATPRLHAALRADTYPPSIHRHELGSHELGLEIRNAVLKKHGYDFLQVVMKLVQRFPLSMSARKTRHIPNIQTGIRAPFYHGRKRSHRQPSRRYHAGLFPSNPEYSRQGVRRFDCPSGTARFQNHNRKPLIM